MSMEERLTICNMAVEGGARVGYINPDQTTVAYLRGKHYVPRGADFDKAAGWWLSMASDKDAAYADDVAIPASSIEPMIAWGINPGQAVGVSETLPRTKDVPAESRATLSQAYAFTSFRPGQQVTDIAIDVAFIGSCTNSRISDLRVAARVAKGHRVAKGVKALVVPGSQQVRQQAEQEGLHEIFAEAGFEWRAAGCSMCLAMNPDKLVGRQVCASSSNRNFIGRQGSPTGRTLLMSPAMVAAAAIAGNVTDVRKMLKGGSVQ
jgi:3-isopropylmalate/(R)-2-methylmalate dehydratase large subunit